MDDEDFEWDDTKAAQNLANHGVSFEAAQLAFDDPFAVVEATRRSMNSMFDIDQSVDWLNNLPSKPITHRP
jgi:hypothetical protein